MSVRPPEDLKPHAHRLAQLLDSDEGAKAIALLQQLKMGSALQQYPVPDLDACPGSIGVWQANGQGDAFVRSEGLRRSWRSWADVERIERRSSKTRIVLLGESVARGHFFDPFYTPSHVLEAMLKATSTLGDVEVVDLACCGLRLAQLRQTIRQSAALDPDAVVIFAGNNWFHGIVNSSDDRRLTLDIAEVLRSGRGVGDVRSLLLPRIRRLLSATLADTLRLNVPVVFVLPEFNLVDWRCAARQRGVFWLPGADTRQWFVARDLAEHAFSAGDYETAARHAGVMTALDKGTSGAGLDLLARCTLRQGARADARRLFEQARDTALLEPFYSSPRVFGVTQELIRIEAPTLGIQLVDLPLVFSEHLSGDLPDRRLFLDYSHLTAEAMQVAMAATARVLVRKLADHEVETDQLMKSAPPVSEDVLGDAHLMAALHNASFGQDQEICSYHSTRAIAHSPKAATHMRDILDVKFRRAPNRICASFARLCQSSRARNIYLIGDTPLDQIMETTVLEAFTGALAKRDPEGLRSVAELICQEHAITASRSVDLLEQRYSATYHSMEAPARSYYRAWDPRSTFFLVCASSQPVELTLAYRLPHTDQPAIVALTINGGPWVTLDAQPRWASCTLHVPGELLRKGINEVTFRWPLPTVPGEQALAAEADQIELGEPFEGRPWFGEVQTLRARLSEGD
jgi:hypothetical protein